MELETNATPSQIENKRWVKNRTISVQATGEVSWPPDLLQFNMMISSTKDSFEAAQGSVKRRTDYILQVLRNNGIKDHDVKCSTEIIRGEQTVVYTDILVGCGSAAVCEQIRNKLMEKLDSSVQFSDVTCQHTLEARANKRCVVGFFLKVHVSGFSHQCNFSVDRRCSRKPYPTQRPRLNQLLIP